MDKLIEKFKEFCLKRAGYYDPTRSYTENEVLAYAEYRALEHTIEALKELIEENAHISHQMDWGVLEEYQEQLKQLRDG